MEIPPGQKQFECEHCQAAILVPVDLPPTSAPCPVCQAITTSPALDEVPVVPEPQVPVNQEATPLENSANSGGDDYETSEKGKGGSGLLWLLGGLTFLAVLAGGFFLFKKFRVQDSPESASGHSEQHNPSLLERAASTGVEKKALSLLEKFFSATSVQDKAQYVIGKEATVADMKAFYGSDIVPKDDLKADFFSEWAMDDVDADRGIHLLQFELPKQFKLGQLFGPITDLDTRLSLDSPDLQTRSKSYRENFEMEGVKAMVFLKENGDDLLIDWHTYIQTKNRLLRSFLSYPLGGREETFRVLVREDVSTIYESTSSTRNYRLADPAHGDEDFVIVSVQRDSQVGKILETLAWTDISGKAAEGVRKLKGATVNLKWSKDPNPVLTLSKVLCWEFLGVGGDPSNLLGQ